LRFPPGGAVSNISAHVVQELDGRKTFRAQWCVLASWPSDALQHGPVLDIRFQSLYLYTRFCSQISTGVPVPPIRIVTSDIPTDTQCPRPQDNSTPANSQTDIPQILQANLRISLTGERPIERTNAAPTVTAVQPDRADEALPTTPKGFSGIALKGESRLKQRVLGFFQPPFTTVTWTLALLFSFFWGATHAFTPGHGKTLVSAYLLGRQASYRHAFLLGILVTLTHTAVVLALGVAAVILQDRFVYPTWLEPLGAVIIMLVGMNQIRIGLSGNLHGHSHTHGHPHTHGEHTHSHHTHLHNGRPVDGTPSGRDILAIGISGGLVPCPAAIIMMLLAWQLHVPLLGLTCLISFSLGLAGTLVGVVSLAIAGLAAIQKWAAKGDEDSHAHHHHAAHILPIIGGLVLILCGLVMLLNI
jgi:ABC-type nickel/cobalt efflux system permease component RcnA